MMLYVEQLERAKDDGDIKVMSTQSVCDLWNRGVNSSNGNEEWDLRTKDRTDAKTGMNDISAIKLDLAILKKLSTQLDFKFLIPITKKRNIRWHTNRLDLLRP